MVLTQTITPLLVVVKEENYKKYVQKKYQFLSVVLWISIILSVFFICIFLLVDLLFIR